MLSSILYRGVKYFHLEAFYAYSCVRFKRLDIFETACHGGAFNF